MGAGGLLLGGVKYGRSGAKTGGDIGGGGVRQGGGQGGDGDRVIGWRMQ